MLQVGTENFIYQGGFMGNKFNFRIGNFEKQYGINEKINYLSNHENNT